MIQQNAMQASDRFNAKQFYRKVETIFQEVNSFGNHEVFARTVISRFFHHLGDVLGIRAIHLYEPEGLLCDWGEFVSDLSDELDVLRTSLEFPWIGQIQGRLAAAIPATEDNSLMAVFLMESASADHPKERIQEVTAAFAALQYAVFQNIRTLELQDAFEQARSIQVSLLPDAAPVFGSFDMAVTAVPARIVGGDIYDFYTLHQDRLGLALADASGHGLPAALQARDVITGLRMAWDPDMDLVRTIEKLNAVVHKSGLGSRFVSLVAGVLESDGLLRYINAGHPPPLLLDHTGFHELSSGGMILGPFPSTRYHLYEARLAPGSMLLLYTDGVVEHSSCGLDFGKTRIRSWMEDWKRGPAGAAIADLYRRLAEFGDHHSFQDDATVMLIRRIE